MRRLIIESVLENSLNQMQVYICMDGNSLGFIWYGKEGKNKASISIDNNEHELVLNYKVIVSVSPLRTKDYFTEPIIIPANDLNYSYIMKKKKSLLNNYIYLEEDPAQKSKNDNEIDIRNQIDAVVNKILNSEEDKRDYSALSFLSAKCRNSEYYKKIIVTIERTILSNAVQYFNENIWDARLIFPYIEKMASIPGLSDTINQIQKNRDYFCPNEERINDGAIESVLPEEDPVSALNNMEAKDIPVLKKTFFRDYKAVEAAYNSDNPQTLQKALQIILCSDYEKEDLNALKKWLLFFGSFREGAGAKDAAIYRALLTSNQKVFHPIYAVGDVFKLGKTVDMLIAEAIRCSRSGSFTSFDEDLEEFLKYTCPFRNVNKSQYDILLKIFSSIGAFNEEKMVLQAMVNNMIERSPEQESRLAFLRNNDVSTTNVEEFQDIDKKSESGQFVYEYRTVNWSAKDIQDYFVSHSAQGIFDENMSYVVAEWSKTINSSMTWDIDAVISEINRELEENYGERLMVGRVKTAINSEWVEFVDTICINEEDNASNKEYRWISFNVIGENITKKQIHIMVQALYWPGVDPSIMNLDNLYSKNTAVAKKINALKGKQNPRWNVYINSVVNIVVSEIEKWINSSSNTYLYG